MGSSYQKYAAMHINFRNQISRTEHARREVKIEENVDIEKRPVKRVEVVAQRQHQRLFVVVGLVEGL